MEAQMPDGHARNAAPAIARIVDGVRTYSTGGAEVRALDGITVDFAYRRFTTVIGPSGSGKSTLLHCLAGLDRLTAGEVYIGDVELGALSRRDRAIVRRENIGVVFQGFKLHPGFDIAHNIALPSLIAGHPPERAWVDEVITRLRLHDLLRRRPVELSGGEQQRVAAARALAGRPRILLADEPTGNLDTRAGRELLDILRLAVDDLEQTVILVTHDPAAARVGDRIVMLGDGKIVAVVDDPTTESIDRLVHRPPR